MGMGYEMQDPMGKMDPGRMNMGTMSETMQSEHTNKMGMGRTKRDNGQVAQKAEEVYIALDEQMCRGISFHEQLADYFCFLGLHGFKRMLEYQYMKECADKRKLHKRYIDVHHKVIPVRQVQTPVFIPKDWNRYTTKDIDDSVIPKFVRSALNAYYEWEEKAKEVYEEQCEALWEMNMVSDYEYVKTLVADVEKEMKKIHRMIESLNGTGYDVNMVHGMQDKYHAKYKKKYEDRFTTKNNYRRPVYDRYEPPYDDDDDDGRRKMGFIY